MIPLYRHYLNVFSVTTAGVGSFSFFFKRSLRYENDNEKTKSETIVFKNDGFLMEIVFKKRSFSKRSFTKTTAFKKLVV